MSVSQEIFVTTERKGTWKMSRHVMCLYLPSTAASFAQKLHIGKCYKNIISTEIRFFSRRCRVEPRHESLFTPRDHCTKQNQSVIVRGSRTRLVVRNKTRTSRCVSVILAQGHVVPLSTLPIVTDGPRWNLHKLPPCRMSPISPRYKESELGRIVS